jgi:hypothetical protein
VVSCLFGAQQLLGNLLVLSMCLVESNLQGTVLAIKKAEQAQSSSNLQLLLEDYLNQQLLKTQFTS